MLLTQAHLIQMKSVKEDVKLKYVQHSIWDAIND